MKVINNPEDENEKYETHFYKFNEEQSSELDERQKNCWNMQEIILCHINKIY